MGNECRIDFVGIELLGDLPIYVDLASVDAALRAEVSARTERLTLAVGEAQGDARGARITGAIALTAAEVQQWLGHRISRRPTLRWVAEERRVEALMEARLGAVVLARGSDPAPDRAAIAAFLCEQVARAGLDLLPFGPASRNLLRRAGVRSLHRKGGGIPLAEARRVFAEHQAAKGRTTSPTATTATASDEGLRHG